MRQYPGGNPKNSSIHHIEPKARDHREDSAGFHGVETYDDERYSESVPDMIEEALISGTGPVEPLSKTIVERSSDVLVGAHDFEGTVASVGDDIISMRKSRESTSDVDPYRDLKTTPPPVISDKDRHK